jgi:argininosuccinate lyase
LDRDRIDDRFFDRCNDIREVEEMDLGSEKSDKLWGGRFLGSADETFTRFNRSLGFDRRLLGADVRASIAHANALGRAAVLSDEEVSAVTEGLEFLLNRVTTEPSLLDSSDAEDIHSFIESNLVAAIGDTGKRLHTGRSRNDQVATALRLWLRDDTDAIALYIKDLQRSIVSAAERHRDAVLPGYTHLQRAQPVLWAHWCLAYFEMLSRDIERLLDARKRINVLPLGAGALAGTGFPIDRHAVAAELGFESVTANSLDAVSDRDFAIEFVAACSILMVHLSRMAEDLIIYCSAEFGFVTLSDAVSTGSSLMPQKKNPDALELIRGKAGRVFGHHTALLSMMKGLPLAYNKDMQEDKEAIFDTVDTVALSLQVAAIVFSELGVNEERTRQAAATGYLNATNLADHLVQKGIPFRTAHDAVGKLVLLAVKEGKELDGLSLDQMRSIVPGVDASVFEALSLAQTLNTKSVAGGTGPTQVAEALDKARRSLDG